MLYTESESLLPNMGSARVLGPRWPPPEWADFALYALRGRDADRLRVLARRNSPTGPRGAPGFRKLSNCRITSARRPSTPYADRHLWIQASSRTLLTLHTQQVLV